MLEQIIKYQTIHLTLRYLNSLKAIEYSFFMDIVWFHCLNQVDSCLALISKIAFRP